MKGKEFLRKLAMFIVMACLVELTVLSGIALASGSVHNANTGIDYWTIQAAIDAASYGDEINVDSGIYYERINVYKENLIINGVDTGTGKPLVNAGGTGSPFTINANGITLDGFNITGAANDYSNAGIRIYSSNNKIENNTVSFGFIGIYLYYSDNNHLSANNISNTTNKGIFLYYSNNNQLSGNKLLSNDQAAIYLFGSIYNSITGNNLTMNPYTYGIYLVRSSNLNTINGNIAKFGLYGIYISSGNNSIIKGNTVGQNGYSGIYFENSHNNTISENDFRFNNVGINSGTRSSNNIIQGNNASNNNFAGITGGLNNNNEYTDNDVSSNGDRGIFMSIAANSTFKRNKLLNNVIYGFIMDTISNNTIIENNVSGSTYGVWLITSKDNIVTKNNISSNKYGFRMSSSNHDNIIFDNIINNKNNMMLIGTNIGTWNTTKQSGINIIGGLNLGGNFWGNPSGTGFSQTCTDTDKDGICNSVYTLDANNIDFLPLAVNDTTAPASVANLVNISYASNHINWTWSDPADLDFSKVLVYLNGVHIADVSRGIQYYNASVEPGTHTIGIRTVDTNGNANLTMKTHTATTILPAVRYINGTIKDFANGVAMMGVKVTIDTGPSIMTDPTGSYSFAVSEGVFTLVSNYNNDIRYYVNTTTVSTIGRVVANQDIEMVMKPTGSIAGSVKVK